MQLRVVTLYATCLLSVRLPLQGRCLRLGPTLVPGGPWKFCECSASSQPVGCVRVVLHAWAARKSRAATCKLIIVIAGGADAPPHLLHG